MSDDNSNLTGAIGALDSKISEFGQQIEAARGEVSRASKKMDELNQSQGEMSYRLNNLQYQFANLSEEQRAQGVEILKKINELQTSVSSNTSMIASHTIYLQKILNEQREELARKNLESARGRFILQLISLLNRIQDGAVRCLFARIAIAACATRGIRSEIFQSLADQKAASDLMEVLASAEREASLYDQDEATLFYNLHNLLLELSISHQRLRDDENKDSLARNELLSRKRSEEDRVALLSKAEEPALERRRHVKRTTATISGTLLLSAGAITTLTATGIAPIFLGLGVAAAISGWLNSDKHRERQLNSHKNRLQELDREFVNVDAQSARFDQESHAILTSFRSRLEGLDVVIPVADPRTPASSKLQAWLAAVQRAENAWREHHIEIVNVDRGISVA